MLKIEGYTPSYEQEIPTALAVWYNRHERSWVVQLLDQHGYEIECEYTGDKIGRDYVVKQYKKEYGLK